MNDTWERYKANTCVTASVGLSVDVSRMRFDDGFLADLGGAMTRAFDEMSAIESGAIANADESRMVGHYWLRAPSLAPTDEIRASIETAVASIRSFARRVHVGEIVASHGDRFTHLLGIGIGGSALGPQFVTGALGGPHDALQARFCDNTDPDGIDRTLDELGEDLESTLVVVISKSGGTQETRNAMLETAHRFEARGLNFAKHAVAVTGVGSKLDRQAVDDEWLARFPMWDWVGGRTSELSAVGLLPAALQGYDIDAMLAGAAACDEATRVRDIRSNPAALLAAMWFYAGDGHGGRNMVILPYKDRLALLGKYLQQLIMESLGKRLDRDGAVVCQGITVYGNKGSTDQHAYVQQLRDGLSDFFATFVTVRRDRTGESIRVADDVTSGDYLHGFYLGTREALTEADRESITITIDDVSPRSVGTLIALFERAVGFYASLINVNAYHQPGVEAGKKAASEVIELQRRVVGAMRSDPTVRRAADEWADVVDAAGRVETVFMILEHLAANPTRCTVRDEAESPFAARYGWLEHA